ncbi:MAG: hypothetical protein DDT19_00260 [Syntrophomonadaceae bacterium]|nr:hypothetical protein [Bacillota bacterium]
MAKQSLRAGIDFKHCEKGQCKNCTDIQKRRCEKQANYLHKIRRRHEKIL